MLLANHLEPGHGLLIYRVQSLVKAHRQLVDHGWSIEGEPSELPQGPCVVFRDPGQQRLAAYEHVRPEADQHFEGRFDKP